MNVRKPKTNYDLFAAFDDVPSPLLNDIYEYAAYLSNAMERADVQAFETDIIDTVAHDAEAMLRARGYFNVAARLPGVDDDTEQVVVSFNPAIVHINNNAEGES